MDEGREKSGWTTCVVVVQKRHLAAVLTMDGEYMTLLAELTTMMLVFMVHYSALRGPCGSVSSSFLVLYNSFKLYGA